MSITPRWPKILYLDVTGRCNGRCIMCARGAESADLELCNWDISDDLLAAAEPFIDNAEIIDVTGYGEFLLSPNAERILRRIADSNATCYMTTNGTLLDRNADLVNSTIGKFGRIIVSIQSHHEERYEELHKGLDYHAMTRGLDFAKAMTDNLVISHTIHTLNIHYLCGFIMWCKERELPTVWVQHIIAQRPAHKELSLANYWQDCNRTLDDAYRVARNTPVNVTLPLPYANGEYPISPKYMGYCESPEEQLFIENTGTIKLCCHMPSLPIKLLECETPDAAWLHEKCESIREALQQRNMPPECAGCPIVDFGSNRHPKPIIGKYYEKDAG